jgi:GTP-binding protein HflX
LSKNKSENDLFFEIDSSVEEEEGPRDDNDGATRERNSSRMIVTADWSTPERALLVGARFKGEALGTAGRMGEGAGEPDLPELSRLAESAGAQIVAAHEVPIYKVHASRFLSEDRVNELAQEARALNANLVIFDDELSPNQQRNLQKAFDLNVIDRAQLILDIFALRARTAEGKLQVELAQLQYMLPRLRGLWAHLERQGGGIGTRGPGERQIESDRRKIRDRITRLRKLIEDVRSSRHNQRRRRERAHLPTVALVGYTNSGKSSLLNALAGASVETRNQLFATLDPTSRLCELPRGTATVLSDTVGFVKKLPHQLVVAFRATLEEAAFADLLLLVADSASERVERDIATTREVLKELGAEKKPILMVWNKTDLVQDRAVLKERAAQSGEPSVFVSAHTGEGLDALKTEMERLLETRSRRREIKLGYNSYDRLAYLHEQADVVNIEYAEDGIRVSADMPDWLAQECEQWAAADGEKKPA